MHMLEKRICGCMQNKIIKSYKKKKKINLRNMLVNIIDKINKNSWEKEQQESLNGSDIYEMIFF